MNEGEDQKDFYTGDTAGTDAFKSTERAEANYEQSPNGIVQWSASEFIDHQKSSAWFLLLGVAAIAVSGIVYFGTGRDIFGPIIIIAVAVIFGFGAARHPRIMQYELDGAGLTIGEKLYPYELFRAFALMSEGPIESILLLPTKRWNPPISIYYDPKDADTIMNSLGAYVPFEEHTPGYVDRFLHKIRF